MIDFYFIFLIATVKYVFRLEIPLFKAELKKYSN